MKKIELVLVGIILSVLIIAPSFVLADTASNVQAEIQTLESQITQLEKTKSGLNFWNDPTGVNKTVLNSLIKAKQLKIVALKKQLQEIQNPPSQEQTIASIQAEIQTLESQITQLEKTKSGLNFLNDPTGVNKTALNSLIKAKQLKIVALKKQLQEIQNLPKTPVTCAKEGTKAIGLYSNNKLTGFIYGEDTNMGRLRYDPSLTTHSIYYDHCYNSATSKQLNIGYCANGILLSRGITCPNGCLNGACKAATVVQPACTDSDAISSFLNGKNYNKLGTVTVNGNSKTDKTDWCGDWDGDGINEKVVEYFCDSTVGQGWRDEQYTCANGCLNGACKAATVVQPACTDSDAISPFLNGKNYNKLGTVTVNGNSKTDWCGDWDGDGINEKVVEYFCDSTVGQGWRDEQYTCANGCLNGACKAATNQTNCTDSDGGDDPNTFGEVTYNLNYAAEYRQTVSDSCYGDSVVFERYCNSEGAQRTYSRTCSAGTTCQGGACKAAVVTYQCNDGIDNDGDTKTDYPNDPGCTSATDNDEYNPPTNQPPTISGVTGPVTLEVNQQGVWSVTANDPENGTMSYRVVWGDEVYTTSGGVSLSPPLIPVQQTTTFTHTYNTVGTYTPVFQVKDDQDEVAETSISVTVVAVTPIQICTPAATTCSGNYIKTCNSAGSAWIQATSPCANGTTCEAGACEAAELQVCTPAATSCAGNYIKTCNSVGSAWIQATSPCANGTTCQGGACKAAVFQICTPAATTCSGNYIKTCNSAGFAWIQATSPCANGTTCEAGACKTVSPPQVTCTDTDGGEDYSKKGTIRTSNGISKTDYCTNELWGGRIVNLIEYFCYKGDRTSYASYGYTCPNGCLNRACIAAVVTYQCNDGIDNDGDTKTDYPNDPGCTSATDNDEYNPPTNQPPTISGVTGPVTLEVNQQGVWSVTANDPENGTMSYRVVWGDEVYTTSGDVSLSPPLIPVQQTTTFTHTYNTVGTYTPVFQVKDDQDEVAETSISVTVVAVTPIQVCTPAATTCAGNYIKTCNSAGSAWIQATSPCANGTTCEAGACKTVSPPQVTCTDTDGGEDYSKKGTIRTSNGISKTDYCTNELWGGRIANLIEYFCYKGDRISYGYTCPNGCLNGACIAAVVQPTTLSVSFNPSFVRVGEPTVFEWIIPSNASKCYGSLGQYVDEAGNSYQKSGEYSFMPFPLESSASPHTRSLTCNLTGGGSVTEIAKVYRDYSNPPTCAKEGETIPVIANPPSCCAGLELIKPKIVGIAGIDGYCTAKCGNGVCDQATETPYNCSKDCIIVIPCPQLVPLAPGFCSNGTVVPGGKDSHNCALPPTCVLTPLSWCYEFKTNLQIGNSSTDVNALKIALQKEGFNPGASAVFEDNIASAVTGFQEKYSGEVLSPHGLTHGTGFVGPTTRAKLNELFKCVVLVPVSEQLGASIAVKSITPLLYVSPYNHKNYGAKECYQSKYCQGSLASIVDTNASKRWWYPAAWRANVLIEYTEKIEGDYTVSFQWVGDGYDPNCGGDIYVSENENGPWTKIVANQGAKTKQTVQRNIPFKFLKTDVCSSDYVSSHYGKGLGGWVGIKEIEVTKSSASLEL